ncbi:SEC-C domain-containing protein [Candidatus Sulfurimonas marisnigri]|uniref:SEC-C domain-containing protein n=1 Tax=Candidatus Sulfurimonas marisnigri TaxID=2740405 RepID=A0A7S7M262_9BACT|nr:SEC-C domain-containing protein [Candidatus Sulfurimonas marisnigri]
MKTQMRSFDRQSICLCGSGRKLRNCHPFIL